MLIFQSKKDINKFDFNEAKNIKKRFELENILGCISLIEDFYENFKEIVSFKYDSKGVTFFDSNKKVINMDAGRELFFRICLNNFENKEDLILFSNLYSRDHRDEVYESMLKGHKGNYIKTDDLSHKLQKKVFIYTKDIDPNIQKLMKESNSFNQALLEKFLWDTQFIINQNNGMFYLRKSFDTLFISCPYNINPDFERFWMTNKDWWDNYYPKNKYILVDSNNFENFKEEIVNNFFKTSSLSEPVKFLKEINILMEKETLNSSFIDKKQAITIKKRI